MTRNYSATSALGLAMVLFFVQPASSAANEQPKTTRPPMSEDAATALAVATLGKELGADTKGIHIVHSSRIDWPDSALGCPEPGLSYTQNIIPGYLVLLNYEKQQYRVHIGNGRAIVCRSSRLTLQSSDAIQAYLRKRAKEDLATRLGIDVARIQVVEEKPMRWSAAEARCTTGEDQNAPRTVRGYLMTLRAEDRTFEYRSSGAHVLACPPIETE